MNYKPFKDFKPMNYKSSTDPVAMCMSDTINNKFNYGGAIGEDIGPRSSNCQHYMGERCAKNWDEACELFYTKNRKWPVYRPNPNSEQQVWESRYNMGQELTPGDTMLHNAAQRKYCTFINCKKKERLFNPFDPNGPVVHWYANDPGSNVSTGCIPVCTVDPETVDNDIIMDKMLSNPEACASTLINICNTTKRQGIDLSGTKIGKVCERYHKSMK